MSEKDKYRTISLIRESKKQKKRTYSTETVTDTKRKTGGCQRVAGVETEFKGEEN